MRLTGTILIVLGTLALVVLLCGYLYLDMLGCGMNTTGCPNYRFDVLEALGNLWLPLLVIMGIIGGGAILRRKR